MHVISKEVHEEFSSPPLFLVSAYIDGEEIRIWNNSDIAGWKTNQIIVKQNKQIPLHVTNNV